MKQVLLAKKKIMGHFSTIQLQSSPKNKFVLYIGPTGFGW